MVARDTKTNPNWATTTIVKLRHHLWRTLIVVVLVLAGAWLWHITISRSELFGTPPGGDPGNVKLRDLINDPVFATLPPGAKLSGPIKQTRAIYRRPGFETGGWDGPTVIIYFTDSQPAATIYHYYALRAAQTGWQVVNDNSLGYTFAWTKTYPGRVTASLGLYNPSLNSYQLSGGTN